MRNFIVCQEKKMQKYHHLLGGGRPPLIFRLWGRVPRPPPAFDAHGEVDKKCQQFVGRSICQPIRLNCRLPLKLGDANNFFPDIRKAMSVPTSGCFIFQKVLGFYDFFHVQANYYSQAVISAKVPMSRHVT